jgi:hypothetical protein
MKRISILVLVVCVSMATAGLVAAAANTPHLGKGFSRHHLAKEMSSIGGEKCSAGVPWTYTCGSAIQLH